MTGYPAEEPAASSPLALDMSAVSKRYGEELVLDDVTFRIDRGTIRGLVGHNGAGKSTLMKIALGAVSPTSGTVAIGSTRLRFSRPAEARDAGVGMVLQELSLIPTLSVADNIFLNDEQKSGRGVISHRSQRSAATALLKDLGITGIRPTDFVADLGIAEQQMVEIAKAFRLGTTLLILDEPTAPLSRTEVAVLFQLIRQTAALGRGVVFITHHLREVFEVCDHVTVLREGKTALSVAVSETTLDDVVTAIVGGELRATQEKQLGQDRLRQDAVLTVRDLMVGSKLEGVSFDLHPGEVVGIAGLAGSGRTTLLKTLYGEIRPQSGEMSLRGLPHRPRNPADAISGGMFLVPEDRRSHGVILAHTIEQNAILSVLSAMNDHGFHRSRRARRAVLDKMAALDVRATGPEQAVGELSGGNQQKVVFAKALLAGSTTFLLDEPTFGVDVHTAAEVIRLIRAETDQGAAALWVSSDLPELLLVCDRVLVLADGRIKAEVNRGEAGFTEESLLRAIQRAGSSLTQDQEAS